MTNGLGRTRSAMTVGAVTSLVVGLTASAGVAADPLPQAQRDRPADPLAEFYDQQLDWKQCEERPPPDPSEQPDDGIIVDPWKGQWGKMECATVTVPVNYRRPADGKLRLDVSRMKATDPGERNGVLLFNPGGPGGGGLAMPLGAQEFALAKHFDLIGFDPRGVSHDSRLQCERVTEKLPDTTRPTDKQFSQYTAYARAKEKACQRAGGGIRRFINTANTARDMDIIRAALEEKKINYLGYSYGTYLGAVYGSLFPEGLNRSVLDSSIHPDWLWRKQTKQQSVGVRFNVEQWAAWVAKRDKTYHLGATRAEVLNTTEALAAELADRSVPLASEPPDDWPAYWPKEVDRSALDSFLAMATQTRPVWDVTAEVIGEIRQAVKGKTTLSDDAGAAIGMLYEQNIPKVDAGVYDTVTCEADWPTDLGTYYKDMRRYRDRYPYKDFNGSGVIGAAPSNCTFRSFTPPEDLVSLKRDGYPTGVVVQGDGDPATQYAGGPAMAAELDNQLISVRDSGMHGHYGSNKCVTEKIDDYLIDGILPPTRSECAADPRPRIPADKAVRGASRADNGATMQARVRANAERQPIWQ